MKYELLALDVDGTLLDAEHRIPPEVSAALARLDEAGMQICLATGRSYIETVEVWKQLPLSQPYLPMVLIGGALVSEPDTGRTLWQKTVAGDVLTEYAAFLQGRGLSVLATVDPWRYGYDYHTAVGDDYTDCVTRWFGQMDVEVRTCKRFDELDPMLSATRLNSLVSFSQGEGLIAELEPIFGQRLNMHVIHAPNYGVTVLEAFSAQADKAAGLRYIAQGLGIGASKTVAIGDDVNDLAMLKAAGLGVAVPNAKDFVKQAADVTASNGLAQFLNDLLSEVKQGMGAESTE